MKSLFKFGIGSISFGIVGMILLSLISLLLYGEIYMYDGYEFTGILWNVCFFAVGLGIFALLVYLATILQEKKSKLAVPLSIALLVIVLIAVPIVLFKACSSSSSSGTCGICGGSGVVTSKILGDGSGVQYGFDTYYRCAGCHGTGRK